MVDGGVLEIAVGERFEFVAGAAGIEHVGHQHRVVVGRYLDAALGKQRPVELAVLADLEDALVFQQRLERAERGGLADLVGRDLAGEQAAASAIAALAVGERHVAGFVGCERKRDAAQRRLHRVDA